MEARQIEKVLAEELSAAGLIRYRSAWYWKHPEIIWVISLRRPFEGDRLSIDVGVATSSSDDRVEWPSSNSCQMQTTFEWLSNVVPDNLIGGHTFERGAFYGIVLDGADTVMSDQERVAALTGIAVELTRIARHVDSLANLKAFLERSDVRKPLMKKEFRKLLEEAI